VSEDLYERESLYGKLQKLLTTIFETHKEIRDLKDITRGRYPDFYDILTDVEELEIEAYAKVLDLMKGIMGEIGYE